MAKETVIEKDIFITEKRVNFCDCKTDYEVRPSALLRMMVQTATDHYLYLGLPHSKLFEAKQIFVLSKIKIKLDRLPKEGQNIVIHTWEKECQPLYFVRNFRIFEGDKPFLNSVSDWLVINPDTRAIIRPSSYTAGKIRNVDLEVDCDQAERFNKNITGLELLGTKRIYESMCDPNGHLHSGNYLDTVFDLYDFEDLKHFPMEISINYFSEIPNNSTVSVYHKAENGNHYFVGKSDDTLKFIIKIC